MGSAVMRGVCCKASRVMPLGPMRAYQQVIDPLIFPRIFRGWGPVPGVAAIEEEALGGTVKRTVRLDDGSTVRETVLSFRPGRAFRYRAFGHTAPVRWWAAEARALWRFQAHAEGTRVTWFYRFQARGALGALCLRVIVKPAFQRAMSTALATMASGETPRLPDRVR